MAIGPMRDGVIADFDVTQSMIKYFINKSLRGARFLIRPRVVIGVPSGVTAVEERSRAGGCTSRPGPGEAYLIEEPMAAAIGTLTTSS